MARKKSAHTSEPAMAPLPEQSGGGVGGDCPKPKRADLAAIRLERMAIGQGWPVKLEDKEQALENIRRIQRDKKAGDRSHIAAARTLATITGQNLAAVDTALRARQQEELDERLRDLEAWRESHGQTNES